MFRYLAFVFCVLLERVECCDHVLSTNILIKLFTGHCYNAKPAGMQNWKRFAKPRVYIVSLVRTPSAGWEYTPTPWTRAQQGGILGLFRGGYSPTPWTRVLTSSTSISATSLGQTVIIITKSSVNKLLQRRIYHASHISSDYKIQNILEQCMHFISIVLYPVSFYLIFRRVRMLGSFKC